MSNFTSELIYSFTDWKENYVLSPILLTVNRTARGGEQTGQTGKHLSGQEQPEIRVVSAKETKQMETRWWKRNNKKEGHVHLAESRLSLGTEKHARHPLSAWCICQTRAFLLPTPTTLGFKYSWVFGYQGFYTWESSAVTLLPPPPPLASPAEASNCSPRVGQNTSGKSSVSPLALTASYFFFKCLLQFVIMFLISSLKCRQ